MKPRLNIVLVGAALMTAASVHGGIYVVRNTKDTGAGSLRTTMTSVNNSPDAVNTIEFNIPGGGIHTIMPLSKLPILVKPVITVPLPAGQVITATATDPDNNTSEFSPCVTVVTDTNYVAFSFRTTTNANILSWPVWAAANLLQRATNLSSPVNWQGISTGITTNGGYKTFAQTNNPAFPTLFFRLKSP